MNSKDIFEIIVHNIKQIANWLGESEIQRDDMLSPLGLDSVGRAELIEKTMEDLRLAADRFEFHAAGNLGELADMMANKLQSRSVA